MKQLMYIVFTVVMLLLVSCSDENWQLPTCPGGEEGQSWLQDKIDEYEDADYGKYFYIVRGSYQGQLVYIVDNCCPYCMTIVPVYDCSGTLLGTLSPGGSDSIDFNEIKSKKVVWTPADFQCSL